MNHLLKLFFVFVTILLVSGVCYAQSNQSELAAKICDIRQLFCGGGGMAVAGFSVGMLGFMAFTGRIHWSVVLVTAIGMAIFIGADQLVGDITDDTNIDSNCECI